MMHTESLTTFVSVARHLNYTRAGEDLHLSQSAVWRQMRQLESRLGVPLFEQIGKDLHLTEAGRELERKAPSVLGHWGRIEEAVRAHGEIVVGRVRLGASTTPGFYLLPPILGAFHRDHPSVELHFEIDNSTNIEEKLVHNELDLALVGGPIHHAALRSLHCIDDEVVCFAAPSHPLANPKRLSPASLQTELCVLREEGSATRALFEDWVQDRGGLPERTMIMRCPEAVKTLVASGVGFSVLSSHAIAAEVGRGDLARLRLSGLKLTRPITLAWHVHKHLSPTIQAFIDRLNAAAATGWAHSNAGQGT